jgi:hypothetical protein
MKGKSAYQPPPKGIRVTQIQPPPGHEDRITAALHRGRAMREAEERALVWEAALALLAGVACVGLLLAWLFWVVHP